jgi:hypothetical protein
MCSASSALAFRRILSFVMIPVLAAPAATACCPIARSGQPVVNADQTVLIIWDAATKTQHFIRRASFKSEADDFGFLVPTPSPPELNESGNDAFAALKELTAPEIVKVRRPSGGIGCGCGLASEPMADKAGVTADVVEVVDEKQVAGFDATVLKASSANALVEWLNDHGFEFSPAVKAWAQPYLNEGWHITALKIARNVAENRDKSVIAAALRLSFHTDRPLFPYREPDSSAAVDALRAKRRLLRIYFVGDARYQGELTETDDWSGEAVWAGKLRAEDRAKLLQSLKLPEDSGPAEWWLTEFEDNWNYRIAPADLYFSRDPNQTTVRRAPIVEYVSVPPAPDVMAGAIVVIIVLGPWVRRLLACGVPGR